MVFSYDGRIIHDHWRNTRATHPHTLDAIRYAAPVDASLLAFILSLHGSESRAHAVERDGVRHRARWWPCASAPLPSCGLLSDLQHEHDALPCHK